LHDPTKSKDRIRTGSIHSLNKKNLSFNIKPNVPIHSNSPHKKQGVAWEIKLDLVKGMELQGRTMNRKPNPNVKNFNKKLRDTLMAPPTGARTRSRRMRYITVAETVRKYLQISKRIFYERRFHMQNKPLLICYFDGVLGFIAKNNLYFRAGVVSFLQNAKQFFQIVLTTWYSTKRNMTIKELFEARFVSFDAIYR